MRFIGASIRETTDWFGVEAGREFGVKAELEKKQQAEIKRGREAAVQKRLTEFLLPRKRFTDRAENSLRMMHSNNGGDFAAENKNALDWNVEVSTFLGKHCSDQSIQGRFKYQTRWVDSAPSPEMTLVRSTRGNILIYGRSGDI
jgi:hypothetical protein